MTFTVAEALAILFISAASVLIAPQLQRILHPRVKAWTMRALTACKRFRDRKQVAKALAAKREYEEMKFRQDTAAAIEDLRKAVVATQGLTAASHQHFRECIASNHDHVVKLHDTQKRINSALAESVDQLRASFDTKTLRQSSELSSSLMVAARHEAKKTMEGGLNKIVPELVQKAFQKQLEDNVLLLHEMMRAKLLSEYRLTKRKVPVPVKLAIPIEGKDAYIVPNGQNPTDAELKKTAVE